MSRISENATTTQKDRIKQSKKLNSKFGEGKLPYRYNFVKIQFIAFKLVDIMGFLGTSSTNWWYN